MPLTSVSMSICSRDDEVACGPSARFSAAVQSGSTLSTIRPSKLPPMWFRIRRPSSGSQGMKTRPILFAALLALSPLFAGLAMAGNHSHNGTSRLGLNDAGKLADQKSDADRWLEYGDRGDDLERFRELRDVAWPAAGGALDVDGGDNGG